jgi:hypothetical protein
MSEYDGLVEDKNFREKVNLIEEAIEAHPQSGELRSQVFRNLTREQAIAWGRAHGENEADRRRELGETRDLRVRQAMAYAVWQWEGKPEGDAHLREFGITRELTGSLERVLAKNGKKK